MAAKKCRVILFLPPKAVQDIYPAIKWFSNHFIKKQYYLLSNTHVKISYLKCQLHHTTLPLVSQYKITIFTH